MMIKKLFSLLSIGIFSATASALAAPKIEIRSELASPIMLENSQEKNYLKVSLVGFEQDTKKRVPINLALVIDRSTSMSGDRIEKAREAAILAINMLDKDDTVSVIAYDSSAFVIIPATKVTDKAKLIKILQEQLNPRGMTALFAGVSKGLNQVTKNLDSEKVNRIILLSDGQANTGPTSIKELSELAKVSAKKGIAITTIGLGNDYNEDLMTAIAGYSDGNHTFVQNSSDLERAFVREFDDVMSVVAQEVVITIQLKGKVKPIRLLGREGDISGNTVKVRMNQLYSNQEKYVLLEVEPEMGKDNDEKPLAEVTVDYDNLNTKKKDKYSDTVNVRYTKSQEAVKKAVIGEVLVEKVIQESVIIQAEALELYKEGKTTEAEEKIKYGSVRYEADMGYAQAAPTGLSPASVRKSEKRGMDIKDMGSRFGLKGGDELKKEMAEDIFMQKNQSSQPVKKDDK